MFRPRRRSDPSEEALGQLPVGIYKATRAGQLLYCNPIARDIFGIPRDASDIRMYSISDRYAEPSERERLLRLMDRKHGLLLNTTIELAIDGTLRYVLDSCCSTPTGDGGESDILGVVCDVTESTEHQRMMQQLPVAVYEVDTKSMFTRANQRVAEILGYDNAAKLIGREITKHYMEAKDHDRFVEEVRKQGRVDNWIIDMVRSDGTPIIIQVSSELMRRDGEETGRFGAFTDVTQSQKVARALGRLPTGYYEVEGAGKGARIAYCNSAFAQMFGYAGPEEMIKRVRAIDLHADEDVWRAYMDDLQTADQHNRALEDRQLHVKRKDGSLFWVAIDCRIEKNAAGRVIGREGTLRDITVQVDLGERADQLRRKLSALTHDMDVLVHRYVSPMMRLDAGLQVQQAMLVATRPRSHTDSNTSTLTERWGSKLEKALVSASHALSASSQWTQQAKSFEQIRNRLTHRRFRGRPVLEDIETRQAAMAAIREIRGMGSDADSGPEVASLNELTETVVDQEIVRNTRRLLSQIAEAYTAIESMRIHFGRAETEYDLRQDDFIELLDSVLETYAAYAAEKGLSFYVDAPHVIQARMAGLHIQRALSNLVLNAIKYSYRRTDGHIDIRVHETEAEVSLAITNYGVPITQEELRDGRIYEYGVRGRFSRDMNRMGSGVGLADVLETASRHLGGVSVDSHAAPKDVAEDDYSVPFLTTVTLWLPK